MGRTLRRRAARVAVLDPDGRVLLLRATDPADAAVPAWWELPGGGLEGDESSEDAGRREVWEEAGLSDLEMSPPVWRRRAVFDWGGYHFDQEEHIHVARSRGGDIRPGGLEALEQLSFVGWRWVPVPALAGMVAAGERVIPPWLAEQLPAVLAAGCPTSPWPWGSSKGCRGRSLGGMWLSRKTEMVEPARALPGRDQPVAVPDRHFVNGHPLTPPWPEGFEAGQFALGCFWGAERVFWQTPGVWTTAAGYAGGYTPNPIYEEVCSGRTGHAETVLVVWDPKQVSYDSLLKVFWEHHDPTQGMRQGNDVGTQYRSAIYTSGDAQAEAAERSVDAYQAALGGAGFGRITTEVATAGPFYYAEPYHQQYLAKNPAGYCGLGGTGVSCPVGLTPAG